MIGVLALGSISAFAHNEQGNCSIEITSKYYCYTYQSEKPVSCVLTFGFEADFINLPVSATKTFESISETECRSRAEKYMACSYTVIGESRREMSTEAVKVKFTYTDKTKSFSEKYKHDFTQAKSLGACFN
jgi:hypothetical protein